MISIMDYASARKRIDEFLKQHGVPANDNKVGRIGEYYAKNYFDRQNIAIKFAPTSVSPYDIEEEKRSVFYSVKTITPENQKQSTELKLNGKWDHLIFVRLDKDLCLNGMMLISYSDIVNYAIAINGTLTLSFMLNSQKPIVHKINLKKPTPYKLELRWKDLNNHLLNAKPL